MFNLLLGLALFFWSTLPPNQQTKKNILKLCLFAIEWIDSDFFLFFVPTLISLSLPHYRLNMMISTQPFGFHLINLFLHIIVSLLVFIIGHRILLFDIHIATIAGLLFAIHPIHTEAIVSIVGRADLLCALFYLLAFLSFHL